MKIMVDVTCSALVEASAATTEMQVSSASEDPTGDESGAGGARRRLPERNMSRIRARLRGLVQSHGQAPVEREQDAPSQDPVSARLDRGMKSTAVEVREEEQRKKNPRKRPKHNHPDWEKKNTKG